MYVYRYNDHSNSTITQRILHNNGHATWRAWAVGSIGQGLLQAQELIYRRVASTVPRACKEGRYTCVIMLGALQVAFQYSLLVHRAATSEQEAQASHGGQAHTLQRRLRILTVAPSVAKSHESVYAGAQLEPVIAVLGRKVLQHSLGSGPADARSLLQACLNTALRLRADCFLWRSERASAGHHFAVLSSRCVARALSDASA